MPFFRLSMRHSMWKRKMLFRKVPCGKGEYYAEEKGVAYI